MGPTLSQELKNACLEFIKEPFAGGMLWRDITSYSRGTQERVPTVLATHIGSYEIVILCTHIHYFGVWIFQCNNLGLQNRVLIAAKTPKEAAEMAIEQCRDHIRQMCKDFQIELK